MRAAKTMGMCASDASTQNIMHNVKLAISSQVQMGILTQWAAGGAASRPIHKINR